MFKKLLTIIVLGVLTASFALLADGRKENEVYILTPEDDARFIEKLQNINYYTPPEGRAGLEEVGRTWYDIATNAVMGRMVAHADSGSLDGLHFVFMKILPQGAERYVTYDYFSNDLQLFFGNLSVTEDRRTGWGRVRNGKFDEAMVSMHSDPVQLWMDAGEAFYSFSSVLDVNPGVFAGFARNGDTIVYLSQIDNLTNQGWLPGNQFFKYSTDYGQTWLDGANPALPAGAVDFHEAERWPEFNPANPSELTFPTSIDEDPSASAGGWIGYATTTDFGSNWDINFIHHDDSLISTPYGNNSQYIIENFSQMCGVYSQDGTFHIVYGAVQGIKDADNSALIDLFPILYWNTSDQEFKILTSDAATAPTDTATINGLADFRSGNNLGNSYPQLSVGPNPGELACIWAQWEDDGSGGLVTVFPTGGTTDIFMTDIWGAYSNDGGATWSDPVKLAGAPEESDIFPNITQNFLWNSTADSVYLDIMYLNDTNPGAGVGASPDSDPSETIWYYERVAMEATPAGVGIDDELPAMVEKFALAQNYPNPFNPATTIEYSLQKPADINLNVYNLVGQKVATLVKGRRSAGQHSVTFDASKLSTGIYFYTLTSGDVKLTRKMMLLK